ncbi:glyoxylase-like metal-dependent hydrolase (beta-lactamase superfamily II) [Orenia metallireducens]|jgi:glyoxylase-like metal-dependent hydrolase (beta-lactamase superfamily II)|uniref:Glyoxylase, beta-lactamase superfamily II n=1 Tax=Orenia metallireducens TaxID=1413210 RepID=A0A285HC74_9FIRM|nr:MBL fold metallo-hydrolase [Orenia metallireducens]PRX28902.1 glyoxylase-like metal-dependent hydrolase (beta-lactamase superfamily II) [Orenia metallireducens]SNY32436.1 Glyoxylase, beta-lactamase superfamily II [Orenia metallireducens]
MEITRIGRRGVLFTFFYLQDTGFGVTTNVYVINAKNYVFVCDTFLGPESMKEVKRYIEMNFRNKPIIVFNSHYDWDHIWGNCTFDTNLILSHELCRNNIIDKAKQELEVYSEYRMGEVNIIPPTNTFSDELTFYEEGVKFFYSPGHTKGSASCVDLIEGVLFAGDNLEAPIPYLQDKDIKSYQKTLEKYQKLEVITVIPGHGEISDKSLIEDNLEYIISLINNETEGYLDSKYKKIHLENLRLLGKL